MATQQRFQFVYGLVVWLTGSLFVLALLDSVTLDLVFVLSFVGFLVAVELTAPFAVTPRWRRRLKWVIALGVLVFAGIVVRRILAILPPGVL
jgi:ABC-type enterochelin transport system permease subunit